LIASTLRIGGGLLMGAVSIWLFNIEGLSRDVVLVYSIMPSAVVNVIICKKYESDAEAVASTVLLTTALSLLTIPLMLAYLGN
jgi:predicted permease